MHTKSHGDVRRFTESRVLSSVMAFAEMIHTIAIEKEDPGIEWSVGTGETHK